MKLTTLLPLAPIVSVLLSAACAPSSTEDAAAADGHLTSGPGGICATLDYGNTVKPVDFYRKFDNSEKAGEFLTKLLAKGMLAGNSGPNAAFKEITQDPRIVRLVGEVFEGFKKAFPRETEGMTTAPPVGIIKTDVVNAFALGPGMVEEEGAPADKAPWIFIIHTALLDIGSTDNELRGLIAHELGHLILRTFLPETRQRVRTLYLTPANEDGILGETQPNDPTLDGHVEEIQKRKDRVGAFPELGIGVLEGPRLPPAGRYLNFIDQLLAVAEAQKPGSCASAKQHIADLSNAQRALLPHADEGNYVPKAPSADEKAHLDQLSESVANDLRACLPQDVGSLMELTAAQNQLPEASVDPADPQHAQLLGLMIDAEKHVDAEMPQATIVDRLLGVQAKVRAELIALKADPKFPIDHIRIYDFEEDADDASVRVLAALGQDPIGNGQLLVKIGLPPALQQPCFDAVAAHQPTPYGQFLDPHPATCWRYYHITQLAKSLGQCTAPSATPAPAKGSGRPSVVDKAPSEVVERGYGRR